jgi:hypothetical protein
MIAETFSISSGWLSMGSFGYEKKEVRPAFRVTSIHDMRFIDEFWFTSTIHDQRIPLGSKRLGP